MCLARMATPAGNNRGVRAPIALKALPKNRLTLLPEEKVSVPWDLRGAKLAALDWPPPPSPSTASRSGSQHHAVPHVLAGATSDVEGGDAFGSSAAADMRSRLELWQIRATIEREKLRMVAPYPFFGCPMRFQDDYAALQVTDDGRFSFSEVSLESLTTVTNVEASEADASTSKPRPVVPDVKHVVTFEGVFTAPHLPTSDDEDQQPSRQPKANMRAKSPAVGRRTRLDSGLNSSQKGSNAAARSREINTEEQPLKAQPEVASIEATGLVRHEIIESGGRCRLAAVERGDFSFVITVCPFFHPEYATVKVLVKGKSSGQPPRRSRRLPYVEASSIVGGSGARTSISTSFASPGGLHVGRGLGGTRKKLSRSLALLPSAAPWNASMSETSPFRRAGVDSLAGRQKVLGSSSSMPNLQTPQGGVTWPV
mmetsp:Transcript_63871/g.101233  ORF Transcript_63871/g.101233 Transcript_63871/m.101233 type:complete len:426 (+) Transcript_63871:113-1390(+)